MLNKLKKSDVGIVAIEFAILFPFLLLILYGVYQVSDYIMAVRRADSVANDIGYILSREGCIAHNGYVDCNTVASTSGGTYSGGADQLHQILDNITPFLIYPTNYITAKANGDLAFDLQLNGLPSNFPIFDPTLTGNQCVTPGDDPTNKIDKTKFRIMWYEHYPATADVSKGAGGSPNANIAAPCSEGSPPCALACNDAVFSSNFENRYGVTTDLVFPGQAVLTTGFSIRYIKILGDNFPGLIGAVLPDFFQKVSSYAMRSSIQINGPNNVKAINYMYICTDCTLGSKFAVGSNTYFLSTQGGVTAGADSAPLRQSCVLTPPPLNTNLYNAGGCTF